MITRIFSLLVMISTIHLMGCTDNVPTVIAANESSLVASGQDTQHVLQLSVPSLAGWGTLSEVRLSQGESLELLATLEHQTGEPMAEKPLYLYSQQGNFFTKNQLTTSHNGQASSVLLATVTGRDEVTISYQDGLHARLTVVVTEAQSMLPTDPSVPELPDLPDVISWKMLAQVEYSNDVSEPPVFAEQVQALHGQEVKVQGFMMPLDNAADQSHFILSVYPPSCFYCLPAGPEGIIEVFSNDAIDFSFDPLLLSGILNVLTDDEMGIFYRIENAQVVSL